MRTQQIETPKVVKVKWTVRASLRKWMDEKDRTFAALTEAEPITLFPDVVDFCAGSKLACELFATATYANSSRSISERVGWVDGEGFFHGECSSDRSAVRIATLIQHDMPELQTRNRVLRGDLVAIALWLPVTKEVGHKDGKGHNIRVGTIEVGW